MAEVNEGEKASVTYDEELEGAISIGRLFQPTGDLAAAAKFLRRRFFEMTFRKSFSPYGKICELRVNRNSTTLSAPLPGVGN